MIASEELLAEAAELRRLHESATVSPERARRLGPECAKQARALFSRCCAAQLDDAAIMAACASVADGPGAELLLSLLELPATWYDRLEIVDAVGGILDNAVAGGRLVLGMRAVPRLAALAAAMDAELRELKGLRWFSGAVESIALVAAEYACAARSRPEVLEGLKEEERKAFVEALLRFSTEGNLNDAATRSVCLCLRQLLRVPGAAAIDERLLEAVRDALTWKMKDSYPAALTFLAQMDVYGLLFDGPAAAAAADNAVREWNALFHSAG
jgi:hypothetical protein